MPDNITPEKMFQLGRKPTKRKAIKIPRFLKPREVERMIAVAEKVYPQANIYLNDDGNITLRNRLIIKLLFTTGIRNNELRMLMIKDIDFQDGTAKVTGKGNKQRMIKIPMTILTELKQYIGNRTIGHVIVGYGSMGVMSKRHIERIIKKCAEECKLRNWDEIHPHTLRHSYATFLRNKGFGLDELQILLGHARLETTRIYAHLGTKELFKKVGKTFEKTGLCPESRI